jgi:predicted RNA-binding Zn ribbon-like protein
MRFPALILLGMEKHLSVATMRMLGGHPGLDLANTVDCRHGRFGPDLLTSYVDLVEWAQRAGLLGAGAAARLREWSAQHPEDAEATLRRVKDLREALYRVFSASASGAEPSLPDLERIGDEARRAQAQRRLARTASGYAWIWPDDAPDALVGRLAHDAAELLTTPRLGRVKECFGPHCGWLFLDTSRNGSRRWCSEEGCGTRIRVARHRARTRQHPSEAG